MSDPVLPVNGEYLPVWFLVVLCAVVCINVFLLALAGEGGDDA